MENIKGMTTCEVCGRDFPLIGEEHYVAVDTDVEGIAASIVRHEPEIYDVFDCPHCGCQNIMQTRKRMWDPCPCEYGCCGDCECEDEEEEKQDE